VELDDPLGNTFIERYDDDSEDVVFNEDYTRTYEQDEEFGLNDMRTENYAEGATEEKGEAEAEGELAAESDEPVR